MWETTVEGRELHFELFGINNQNFIMRDQETGSWWQQVSGEALHGPLKGKRLNLVGYEEVTFDFWKKEEPDGRVLLPDPEILKKDEYAKSDWEARIAKLPVVGPVNHQDPLKPRDLIVGIELNGNSKAYPFTSLKSARAIVDSIQAVPVLILLGEDGLSVRAFQTNLEGKALNLFVKNEVSKFVLLDSNTGSEWNFNGTATSGPLAGKSLTKIPALKDYWFDWKNYHPQTTVYLR